MSDAPDAIKLHKRSATLELVYGTGEGARHVHLSHEFLRVHSPSAEVRGHGKPILQTGKQQVTITHLEPAGHYALKICFDDGHDSGLYSWDYLKNLCENHDTLWQEYLNALEQAGASRKPTIIGRW